jgi:hypothetical protein
MKIWNGTQNFNSIYNLYTGGAKKCIHILTFMNRASYIYDRHTATLQTPHFMYIFKKYTY